MVGRALKWTFESLYEDDELERFFASIPGFCSSKVVDDPQRSLAQLDSWMSAQALEVFLDHTWTFNLVSEAVKQRRLVICVRAADAARLYFASEWILRRVFSGRFRGVLQSVQMGRALGSNSIDGETGLCAQSIAASIIANVRERDSDWFALAVDQLSVSEDVLRGYVSHGDDSVLLANLMHITRQIFLSANRDLVPQLHSILRSVSHFDVQNALPGLRHDFCTLWNEIVLEVQNKGSYTPILILVHTRHIYTALHQGADTTPAAFLASVDDADAILYQPFSYPLCNIPGHLSDPPSHIHERVDASPETALAPAAPSLAILHRDVVGTATAAKLSLNRPRLTQFLHRLALLLSKTMILMVPLPAQHRAFLTPPSLLRQTQPLILRLVMPPLCDTAKKRPYFRCPARPTLPFPSRPVAARFPRYFIHLQMRL